MRFPDPAILPSYKFTVWIVFDACGHAPNPNKSLTYTLKCFFDAQYFSKICISSHRAETSLQYSYVYILSVNWPISSWRYFLFSVGGILPLINDNLFAWKYLDKGIQLYISILWQGSVGICGMALSIVAIGLVGLGNGFRGGMAIRIVAWLSGSSMLTCSHTAGPESKIWT